MFLVNRYLRTDDSIFLRLKPAFPGLAGPIFVYTTNWPLRRMSVNTELNLKDFAGVYINAGFKVYAPVHRFFCLGTRCPGIMDRRT